VVDVSEARFIDCSFLRNLTEAQRLSRERRGTVRLHVGTAQIVARILEASNFLAGIDHAFSRTDEAK
jgi:anti-anti-sigma regulatory factor